MIRKRQVYTLLLFLMVTLTTLFVASLLLYLAVLPIFLHSSEHSIFGSATISLDPYVNRWWLRSMEVAFGTGTDCSGKVGMVEGRSCSDLPVVENQIGYVDQACHVYSLPGSSFVVSFQNNTEVWSHMPHVWVTHSLLAYQKLLDQVQHSGTLTYKCDEAASDATCYSAKGNIGSFVTFNVTKPGYYCIFITDSSDSSLLPPGLFVRWSYTNITYDFATIFKYPVMFPWVFVSDKSPERVPLSLPFHFSNDDNCMLFDFDCSNSLNQFSITHLKKRWDLPVLLSVMYFVLMSVIVCVFLVVKFQCWNRKR